MKFVPTKLKYEINSHMIVALAFSIHVRFPTGPTVYLAMKWLATK